MGAGTLALARAMSKPKRLIALLDGVLRGLEAAADTFTVNHYHYEHESECEAMRDDWRLVGRTIADAIDRAEVKAAS